jgi:hypothetical protein
MLHHRILIASNHEHVLRDLPLLGQVVFRRPDRLIDLRLPSTVETVTTIWEAPGML